MQGDLSEKKFVTDTEGWTDRRVGRNSVVDGISREKEVFKQEIQEQERQEKKGPCTPTMLSTVGEQHIYKICILCNVLGLHLQDH